MLNENGKKKTSTDHQPFCNCGADSATDSAANELNKERTSEVDDETDADVDDELIDFQVDVGDEWTMKRKMMKMQKTREVADSERAVVAVIDVDGTMSVEHWATEDAKDDAND